MSSLILKNRNTQKTLFVFFLTFLISASSSTFAQTCTDLLSVPGDYMSYVNKAEERRGESKLKHPEFLNPETEKRLSKTWQGEIGPEALQKLLPPGVSFVGHQLRKASAPGVVKVEQKNGDFLILRVEMEFKGKLLSTNVTVNAQALYENLHRALNGEPLWLIGPDATAALDWGHGGGTKTTGGHTADTLMNYMAKYNVFTFGMDQPWHGEGVREWFENDEEYFEFRVAFRNKFVHPDVPTFLIGHSKGGIVADMALRRTGRKYEKLGLHKAYVGMIPLSFVPDDKPGGTFEDKTTAARMKDLMQKEDEIMARINPEDCKLFANLMAEDKISALSGLMCTQLSMFNSWEKGTDISLPALYIMGEHDGLYILKEDQIEEYVRALPDTTLWTFSSRVHFRGDVEAVGHMIFDHYMPKKDHAEALNALREYLALKNPNSNMDSKTDEELRKLFREEVLKGHVNEYTYLTPVNNYDSTLVLMAYQWVPEFKTYLENRIASLAEGKNESVEQFKPGYFLDYTDKGVFETYQVIKEFIAKVLNNKGIELTEITPKQRLEEAKKNNDPLADQRESILGLLKAYGNNLAFREYLKEFVHFDIGATEDFQKLNMIGGQLTQRIKMVTAIRKEKISDEEKAQKIMALGSIEDDQGTVLDPSDVAKMQEALDRIQEIRTKRWVPEGELKSFAENNIHARLENHVHMKDLEHQRDKLKKEMEELKREVSHAETRLDQALNGANSEALRAYEEKRVALYNELETYDLKVRDVQEAFLVEILRGGRSMAEAFDQLPKELLKTYQDAEKASQDYQELLKQGDALLLEEALSGALGGETQKLAQSLEGAGGLREKLNQKTAEYNRLEYGEVTNAKEEQDQLLADYIEKVMPNYFVASKIRVMEILNSETSTLEELRNAFRYAEKALSQWRGRILISKPEGGDTSLY